MYRTLVQLFDERVKTYPLYTVQLSKNEKGQFIPKTYIQLQEEVRKLALALMDLGLTRGENVGLISDNREEWLASDLAVLALGCADVPRGRDAMSYELQHILSVTNARFCFVENQEQLKKITALLPSFPSMRYVIVFDDKGEAVKAEGVTILRYQDLLDRGSELIADSKNRDRVAHEIMLGGEEDIATIIFTSGTTGLPKGVMLTHRNFLYQTEKANTVFPIKPGQKWLSVLPVWHSFERIIQYVVLYYANAIAYSKPIGKIMLLDIQRVNPDYMGSVPRIWETVRAGVFQNIKTKKPIIQHLFAFFLRAGRRYVQAEAKVKGCVPQYKKRTGFVDFFSGIIPYLLLKPIHALGNKLVFNQIKEKLGKHFIMGFSGGGSMPKEVDEFFRVVGITLVDGYGLTESAPVLAAGGFTKRTRGVMNPFGDTELKVIDENGKEVGYGEKGELIARGPQIMKGYYQDEAKTALAIDKEGYLHTGDLATMTRSGQIAIVGRVKDTIVLSGGENIEPLPIEATLRESEYIETAVVIGQDKKYLSALLVVNLHTVERYLKDNGIPYVNRENFASKQEVVNLINHEVQRLVNFSRGFKAFEQISRFALLEKSFTIGKELSAKQEVKRNEVNKIYKDEIDKLYA